MVVKKRLIYFLITLVVILLLGDLILDNFNPPKSKILREEVSSKIIEGKFKQVLAEYGIKKDWIKKIKLKKKATTIFYRVNLSNDISIPELITDIKKSLVSYNLKFSSIEKQNYGNSDFVILNNGKPKFKVQLKYNPEIKRNSSEIAFIISNVEALSEKKYHGLLRVPYKFGFAILPDADTEEMASEIRQNNKEYYLIIDDDISDERFELNDDFSKGVILRTMNNMFKFFKATSFFLINTESGLYNSAVIEYVKKVLKRNKKRFYYIQDFTKLQGESEKDLKSLYDFYILNIKPQEKKIFLLSSGDFLLLLNKINDYVKKGNKVISASNILRNME